MVLRLTWPLTHACDPLANTRQSSAGSRILAGQAMHGSGLLKPSPLPCQHVLVGWACHTLPSWDGLRTGMADMGAVHDTCTLRSSSAESAGRTRRRPCRPSRSRSVMAATEAASGRHQPLTDGVLHAHGLGSLRDPDSRPARGSPSRNSVAVDHRSVPG